MKRLSVRTSTWWTACFILAIIAVYIVTSHNGRQREYENTSMDTENERERETRYTTQKTTKREGKHADDDYSQRE